MIGEFIGDFFMLCIVAATVVSIAVFMNEAKWLYKSNKNEWRDFE